MKKPSFYIGVMSGTSMDGIDAVIADFSYKPQLLAHHYLPYPKSTQQRLFQLVENQVTDPIQEMAVLDVQIGQLIAQTVLELLSSQNLSPQAIKAVGSHGQTILHQPKKPNSNTLQIGDPNTIAELTGITTICDFRRRDMVRGGQGAPLLPAFHRIVFNNPEENRAIVNIGGLANITYLPKSQEAITGFDCGPGNILLDSWIKKCLNQAFDENGQWAMQGKINPMLLAQLLQDPFFRLPPPKSADRKHFNLKWLEHFLNKIHPPLDSTTVQRTLIELTVQTISKALHTYYPNTENVIVCGGGAKNSFLMEILKNTLSPLSVVSTAIFGIAPTHLEAWGFAWLARQTLHYKTGNCPTVTGADGEVVLGGIYPGQNFKEIVKT